MRESTGLDIRCYEMRGLTGMIWMMLSDAGINWMDIDVLSDTWNQLEWILDVLSDAGINWVDIGCVE